MTAPERALIIGGTGSIGEQVRKTLLADGHEVAVVGTTNRHGAPFYSADITDFNELRKPFQHFEPTVVFHLAAILPGMQATTERTRKVNFSGTENVVKAVELSSSVNRLIFSSSAAVYGEVQGTEPIQEDQSLNPTSDYGKAKAESENTLRQVRSGVIPIILRYSNVYGPGQQFGLIRNLIRSYQEGQAPELNGNGKTERDYVHVMDVARANSLALSYSQKGLFNISSGEGVSTKDLTIMVAEILNSHQKPIFHPEKSAGVPRSVLSNKRAMLELGWKPHIPLKVGLQATIG